jgi:hypothetical protein
MMINQGILFRGMIYQTQSALKECHQLLSDVKCSLFLGTFVALIILALGFLLSAQVSPRVTFKPVAPLGQNASCTRYR